MAERVMIHACPQRMWYVDGYLTPSLREQGLDVEVWNDEKCVGNLRSCVASFKEVGKRPGATWHLQDDVIVCRDFAERIPQYDGVACGMYFDAFGPFAQHVGKVPAAFMWNSWPCIRIPNETAGEFAEWFETDAKYRPELKHLVDTGKKDDTLWREFFIERHGDDYVTNIVPSLADHIDWLIGGSVLSPWRGFIARSKYWEDNELVDELKGKLARR